MTALQLLSTRIMYPLVVVFSFLTTSYSQTTILDEPGPFIYPANDMVNTDNYNVIISNCTSVSVSFDFEFNLPWEGSGNMESVDDCPFNIGNCNGNPDAQNTDCANCWDFLDWQVNIDGTQEGYDIIGDAGTMDDEQMGTINFGPVCTIGDNLNLRIRNQSWSADEEIRYSNIIVMCWEGQPEIEPFDDLCEGEALDLNGSATDESIISDWLWSNDGGGSIANANSQNTITSSPTDGETYTLTVTDENNCEGTVDETVTFIEGPTVTPVDIMGCTAELMSYNLTQHNSTINGSATVTWYDGQPSNGGSLIGNPSNADVTSVSSLWVLVTDSGTGCTSELEIMVTDTGGPTGELSGAGDLCPGECTAVFLNLSGGSPPYLVDISLFTFPAVSIPGIGINDAINVCYDPTGGFSFQQSSLTFFMPEIPLVNSIDMTMNGILDDAGCMGIVNGGSVSINFNDPADINMVGPYEECDNGSGMATFDLSSYEAALGGGNITFYSDPAGSNTIPTSYTTGNTTIYAQILGSPCDSEIVPIELNVVANGDAGIVTIYCDTPGNTSCTHCTDGSTGAGAEIFISFTNPNVTSFNVSITNTSGTTVQTFTTTASNLYTIALSENSTIQVTLANITGECADDSNLGGIISLDLEIQPFFVPPVDITACTNAILPIVPASTGADPIYYSMPGGMGDMFAQGSTVSMSGTYYLYSGSPGCELEHTLEVTILTNAMLDAVDDVVACGSYTLPQISGTNILQAGYFTGSLQTGTPYEAGDVITESTLMYIYAQCGDNEMSFDITVSEGPSFDVSDTLVCDFYVVPTISSTPSSTTAAYFEEAGGTGANIMVGDTIFQDSTIYLYDNTAGCIQDIPIDITINIKNSLPDTTFQLCAGNTLEVRVDSLYGIGADTLGYFINSVNMDSLGEISGFIIDDSTLPIDQLYSYITYDSLCGRDTANLSFLFSETAPISGIRFNPFICENDCLDLEIYASGVDSFYVSVSDGIFSFPFIITPSLDDTTGILNICNTSDNVFDGQNLEPNNTYTVTIDSMSSAGTDCTFGQGVSVMISTLEDIEVDHQLDVCGDMDIDIGGTVFNPANPSGAVTFTSIMGCDSIVNVDIDFGDSEYTTVSEVICGDTMLDLSLLISGFDGSGTFSENPVSGGLSGSVFNTTGLPIQNYQILYTTTDTMCSDTTEIQINLTGGPQAGNDVIEETCFRNNNLFDYLSNADLGGDFYDINGGLITDGLVVLAPGDVVTYFYNIGGGTCPIDAAEITLVYLTFPDEIDYTILIRPCLDECGFIRAVIENFDTIYFSITDGTTTIDTTIAFSGDMAQYDFCNLPDGVFTAGNLEPNGSYTVSIDSLYSATLGCTFEAGDTWEVTTNTYASNYTNTFCSDTTVIIGDHMISSDFVGSTIILGGGQFGCDSTVFIDISFEDPNFGTQSYSACAGMPFVDPDFGEIWTSIDNQRDVIIPNGSANGCDSIVSVTVIFSDEVIVPYQIQLCSGQFETVLGVMFNEFNTSDTLNTGVATANGCDSLIAVIVTLDSNPPTPLTGDVCTTYEEEVASGVFFNMSNPGEIASVGIAMNGCDSLIINDYNFVLTADTTYIDTTVCDPTFFIQIGQLIYDIDLPSGLIDYPGLSSNGCDSIISINIDYNILGIDFEIIPATCNTLGQVQVNVPILNGVISPLPEFPITFFADSETDSATVQFSVFGCTFTENIYVPNSEEFVFDISVSDGQVTIDTIGSDAQSIVWTPSDGLSCSDCFDPTATPTETTTYIGLITYGDGCTAEVKFTIEVAPPVMEYYFPNVISINGNPSNRVFKVIPSTFAQGIVTSMNVYDRWGNLMYVSTDSEYLTNGGGWDGTKNGTQIAQGVYVYIVTILEPNGDVITEVGDVTLLE